MSISTKEFIAVLRKAPRDAYIVGFRDGAETRMSVRELIDALELSNDVVRVEEGQ